MTSRLRVVPGAALALLLVLGACRDARDAPLAEDVAPSGLYSPGPADSLLAEADRVYAEADYEGAADTWSRAVERARTVGDSATEARALIGLALARYNLGELEEARDRGEEALGVQLRHGIRHLLPRTYNAIGLMAWQQSRFTEAAQFFELTMAVARDVGDAEYVEKPGMNLGLIYQTLGEYAKAREAYLTARAGGRALGDVRLEARSLINLAWLEREAGNPGAALVWLDEAAQLDLPANDPTAEEAYRGHLAWTHMAIGEPGRAVASLDSALHLARAQGLRQAEAANLEALAEVYRLAGDLQRALHLYEQANRLNRELGLAMEVGSNLRSRAEIHQALGNSGLALRRAEEALEIHRSVDARYPELASRLLVAELMQTLGDEEGARARVREARQLAEELGTTSAALDVRLAEARLADRQGDSQAVLRVLAAAESHLLLASYGVQSELETLRARAHRTLGDLAAAESAGRRAVAAVERVRAAHGSAALRTSYLANRAMAYAELIDVLLGQGNVEDAFQVADAARGRALLEHLVLEDNGAGLDARGEEATRGEALRRRVEALAAGIRESEEYEDSVAARELAEALERARREYEIHLINVSEGRNGREALLGISPADPATILSLLEPDEALVEYFATPARLLIFTLGPGGLQSFTAEAGSLELADRVRLARELAASPEGPPEEAEDVLEGLHELLLGAPQQARAFEGVRRLIVIPHGSLVYLPFAALRDREKGAYLVEAYELLHLPSAAALEALRTPGGGVQAAEAHRVGRHAVFVPEPGRLPGSRAEGRAARDVFGEASLHIGRRATEARLREALAEEGIVHVASHGVLKPQNPMFSRIELFRPRGFWRAPRPEEDGWLEVHEVLRLTIRSPFVFLSGCETGLGARWSTAFAQGEDYATLAQAFLYAGARNVAATLWPVADDGAAAFAARFYRYLTGEVNAETWEAADPGRALAEAQREMLSHSRYGHPYYWAGYRLSGSGSLGRPAHMSALPSVSR